MKLHKRIPGIRLYRRLRYRKGYGVHSPFVYSFITRVIEEKASFYAFDEIEKLRKTLAASNNELSRLTLRETQHRNYGALLFRMAHFFKCRSVIQIGGSTGIMSLYLASALPGTCRGYVLENRQGVLDAVKDFSRTQQWNHFRFIEGAYETELQALRSTVKKADMVFINQLPETTDIDKIKEFCYEFIDKKTICVIDNITNDTRMKALWQQIKNHSQARVTIDLYALGIVFFDDNLPRKPYKVYFDYGKKQHIHKNRRRRLHFISRRKKSLKNASAH
jgi:predicted O-methyltransferase YrrM